LFLLYHSSLSVLQPARKHAALDVIAAVDAGVLQSVNSASKETIAELDRGATTGPCEEQHDPIKQPASPSQRIELIKRSPHFGFSSTMRLVGTFMLRSENGVTGHIRGNRIEWDKWHNVDARVIWKPASPFFNRQKRALGQPSALFWVLSLRS
jgi:hypothetical protein